MTWSVCHSKVAYSIFALMMIAHAGVSSPYAIPNVDSLYRHWQEIKAHPDGSTGEEKVKVLTDLGDAITYFSPDSSLFYYHQALNLAQANGLRQRAAALQNQIGYTHYILGEYNQALPYFLEALSIFKFLDNPSGIAVSLNRTALIYETQGEYQKALEYELKSISFAKKANDLNTLVSNYLNIGIIYDDLTLYDSALFYLNKSAQLLKKMDNAHIVIMVTNRKGEVYFHKGEYEKAEVEYKNVLHSTLYRDNWETCFAYAGLAQTYRMLKNYDASIASGLKGLTIAKEMNAKWEIARIADILYQTYEAQHAYKEALNMHVLFKNNNDSVFNETKAREINYLHLKQNEIERQRLENENQLQQAKLDQNNLWIAIFCFGGVFLVMWGTVLYRNNRRKVLLNEKLMWTNKSMEAWNAKIEQQNEELNRLNESKSQLLSIIGHDMRSPINNIKTILEFIKDGRMNPDDQQKVFANFHQTISTVAETMENMLTWASSQLNGIQNSPTSINLVHATESQLQLIHHSADKKKIELIHEKEQELLVWADVNHVRTVVRNLLNNAIKFTRQGGKVKMSYLRTHHSIGLQIEDTGVGIPEEKLKELFVFKGKSQSVGTDNERGTGIGLMLSKDFVESNGGKIEVTSEVGKGSTFTVWLPIANTVQSELAL